VHYKKPKDDIKGHNWKKEYATSVLFTLISLLPCTNYCILEKNIFESQEISYIEIISLRKKQTCWL